MPRRLQDRSRSAHGFRHPPDPGDGPRRPGAAFTREELRTLAVRARGDDPPPLTIDPTRGSGGTLDLCGHLTSILGDEAVRRFLAKHELDPDRITECVKAACR